MMKYMLDTNICIYLMKRDPRNVLERFKQLQPGDITISSMTLAELQYGVAKSQQQTKNQAALAKFLMPLEITDFDANAAAEYGRLRNELSKRGKVIGSIDLFIAAHALSLRQTLVTNNVREFSRVSGLLIENWTE